MAQGPREESVAQLISQHRGTFLTTWMKAQLESPSLQQHPIHEETLREHAVTLLDAFIEALGGYVRDQRDEPHERLLRTMQDTTIQRAKMGFPPADMAAYLLIFREAFMDFLIEQYADAPQRFIQERRRVTKLFDELMLVNFRTFVREREQIIHRQQQDILEISTPAIQVWERILVLPIIGTLDSHRTQVLMESMLQKLATTGSEVAIIGFSATDQTRLATAASEVVRCLFHPGHEVEAEFSIVEQREASEIEIIVRNPSLLELGALPGRGDRMAPSMNQTLNRVRNLVERLVLDSDAQTGTQVILRKSLLSSMAHRSGGEIAEWQQALRSTPSPLTEVHERGEQLIRTLEQFQRPSSGAVPAQTAPSVEARPSADVPAVRSPETQPQGMPMEAILDATGDAIVMYDARGSLQLANQWFGRMFGLAKAELRGLAASEVCQRMRSCFADPEGFEAIEPGFLTDPESVYEGIVEVVSPERRMLYRFSAPVRAADGNVTGRLVLYRDVSKEIEIEQMKAEVMRLRVDLKTKYAFDRIVGGSAKMARMYHLMQQATASNISVLVQGESGTGKEWIARAIHFNGGRRQGPFVAVNCAAIPETLIESELFGHEKGAFTGAVARKAGREDLYYRIAAFPIVVPPLRERADDIPLLVEHFLEEFDEQNDTRITKVSRPALQALMSYHWPGNVRELRNVLERAVLLGETGTLQVDDLPTYLLDSLRSEEPEAIPVDHVVHSVQETEPPAETEPILTLEEVERQAIIQALAVTGNNVAQAAQALGINRATLYRKMKRYGLPLPQ